VPHRVKFAVYGAFSALYDIGYHWSAKGQEDGKTAQICLCTINGTAKSPDASGLITGKRKSPGHPGRLLFVLFKKISEDRASYEKHG